MGIFIHYGPSSLLNVDSEQHWIDGIQSRDYPQTVAAFRPDPAAVAQWVSLAASAGASYLVFVAKHHDGYTLWRSAVPVDRSAGANKVAWGVSVDTDVLAALAAACRLAHIKLYLYYSLIDWYEHAYRTADSQTHLAIETAQLRELLTNYGPIAGVWLDGVWNTTRPAAFWHLADLVQEIHALQPGAELAVNRFPPSVEPGENYKIYEKTIPPAAPVSWINQAVFPIGGLWYYSSQDTLKTAGQLRSLIATTIGRNNDLLLDLPPQSNGLIPDADALALLAARASERPKRALPKPKPQPRARTGHKHATR